MIVALLFAVGVLSMSVYRVSVQAVDRQLAAASLEFYVQEPEEAAVAGEKTEDVAPEPVAYDLNWPGLLPDHFLYPVKMLRDRVWLFLTADSLKKAELLLKYADKRIWAAQLLTEADKHDLAVSTATKAEKYLEEAVVQEKNAREKGKETAALLAKLSLAVRKHEEVQVFAYFSVGGSSIKQFHE